MYTGQNFSILYKITVYFTKLPYTEKTVITLAEIIPFADIFSNIRNHSGEFRKFRRVQYTVIL